MCLCSVVACGADDEDDARCTWGVDDLLAEAGVAPFERMDCGETNSGLSSAVQGSLSCFEAAPAGAEFTVNYCIDCAIPSTYVKTPEGRLLEVRMENDQFGDALREARVDECDNLVYSDEMVVECVNATRLYACTDEFVGQDD